MQIRAVEQFGDVPGAAELVPQERRVQQRTCFQGAEVSIPQTVQVAMMPVFQERVFQQSDEQVVDVSGPQIIEFTAKLVPHERLQQHTVDDAQHVLVPQEREQLQAGGQVHDVHVPKMQNIPPKHVSERMVDLQVHVPLPQVVGPIIETSEDHCGATRA